MRTRYASRLVDPRTEAIYGRRMFLEWVLPVVGVGFVIVLQQIAALRGQVAALRAENEKLMTELMAQVSLTSNNVIKAMEVHLDVPEDRQVARP